MQATKPIDNFQKLDSTITDVDRFVDAYMISRIKRNHNQLMAESLCNDILSQQVNLDLFGTAALTNYPSEIIWSAILPIRDPVTQVVFTIQAIGDANEEQDIKVYPFCVPWGQPPQIETARYVTFSTTASVEDVTVDLRGKVNNSRGFGLWHAGLVCEDTTTNTTVHAALTITGATNEALYVTHNLGGIAIGQMMHITTDVTIPAIYCSYDYYDGASITKLWMGRRLNKLPRVGTTANPGDTVTIKQVYHGFIKAITIREAVLTTFNRAQDGL